MRSRHVLAYGVTAMLANVVSASVLVLPLEWVDRQAYVATVYLDGVATQLQISTILPYTWAACGLLAGPSTCQPDSSRCDATIYAETNHHCASQRSASLEIQSPATGGSLATQDLPLRIAQYHNLSQVDDTKVYTLPTIKPNYDAEQPRLVTGAVGALGLGRGTLAGYTTLANLVRSFSLFVTSEPDGSTLLLDVSAKDAPTETFDQKLFASKGLTTNFTLPVRTNTMSSDANESTWRWDLSLVGVRFGEDTPLYPRVYSWSDTVGSDAAATLSLNHAVLEMPVEVLRKFQATFLASCSFGPNAMRNTFFLCPASVKASLPRITLFLGSHTFFLDPDDYTHVPPNNALALAVQLDASDDNAQWVLGAPFLRKFPVRLGVVSQDVVLFCRAGASCREQSLGTLERMLVQDNWLPPLPTIPSRTLPTSGDRTSPHMQGETSTTYTQSPMLLAAIWVGRSLAVLILLATLLRTIATCRDRLLGRRRGGLTASVADDMLTVASERDLEESKAELRAMAAAEEATAHATARRQQRRSRTSTTAVEDDRASSEYARLESPRPPPARD